MWPFSAGSWPAQICARWLASGNSLVSFQVAQSQNLNPFLISFGCLCIEYREYSENRKQSAISKTESLSLMWKTRTTTIIWHLVNSSYVQIWDLLHFAFTSMLCSASNLGQYSAVGLKSWIRGFFPDYRPPSTCYYLWHHSYYWSPLPLVN